MPDIPDLLNVHLATHIDLHAQLKQAHWNLRGPSFIGLHQLFDKAAGDVEGYYDTLAERAAALGVEARGRIEDVADSSLLKPYVPGVADQARHISAVMTALTTASEKGREAIAECLEAKDQASADVFIEIVRGVDQLRYLVGSHQE